MSFTFPSPTNLDSFTGAKSPQRLIEQKYYNELKRMLAVSLTSCCTKNDRGEMICQVTVSPEYQQFPTRITNLFLCELKDALSFCNLPTSDVPLLHLSLPSSFTFVIFNISSAFLLWNKYHGDVGFAKEDLKIKFAKNKMVHVETDVFYGLYSSTRTSHPAIAMLQIHCQRITETLCPVITSVEQAICSKANFIVPIVWKNEDEWLGEICRYRLYVLRELQRAFGTKFVLQSVKKIESIEPISVTLCSFVNLASTNDTELLELLRTSNMHLTLQTFDENEVILPQLTDDGSVAAPMTPDYSNNPQARTSSSAANHAACLECDSDVDI